MAAVTEEELVGAIKALVAAGEYLDEIPGVRGARLSGGGVFGGIFGNDRRFYERGSAEHLEARAAGLVEKLPPLKTASSKAIDEAERDLGFSLPRLLRRLYLEVGNGGFGPGNGILGVRGGHRDDLRDTAVDSYRRWRAGRDGRPLPEGLLPICHWGCGNYSFVELTSQDAVMWACDPNPGYEDDLFREPLTLKGWLERWLEGTLHQPALVEDPDTGAGRPATDEDWEEWTEESAG